ncbi:MAG: hypothetical protein IBX39_08120 [Candidatus Methanoperedenaceae archaeon]|nr:hypothetical protein [Candidatus Methanoperedenaceae archaeon]
MKDELIKLTNEKDIFYDSIKKVYRYRMHCPNCGTVIKPYKCYHDLDVLRTDINEGLANYTCSSKCALLIGNWNNIDEVVQLLGLDVDVKKDISELTEDQATQVLNILTDGEDYFDYPHGEDCTI